MALLGPTLWRSALLGAGLLSCVDASSIEWPKVAEPFQSRIFARECNHQLEVWAWDTEAPPALTSGRCESGLRYFLAHFEASLSELRIEPGPVRFEPCSPALGRRCTEEPLPSPGPEGLYAATPGSDGARVEWVQAERWPASIGERRFPRRNRCPEPVRKAHLVEGYLRFKAAFLDEERLLLMGEPSAPTGGPYFIHLFDTSLTELRAGGLPSAPNRGVFPYRGTNLEVDQTGRAFIGLSEPAAFLVVSPDGEHHLEPHPVEGRRAAQVALRPGARPAPELVVRDPAFSSELHFYGPLGWRPFDGRSQMVGQCTPDSRGRGQNAAMFWRNEDELIALPNGFEPEGRVDSSTTTPDGYWHVLDGRASWRRVSARQDNDCISRMAEIPGMGLVAVTKFPRFYQLRSDEWRELELSGLSRRLIEDELNDLVGIEHGFAFTREGKRFGYVVDGVVCDERAFDTTDLDVVLRSGRTVLVLGEARRDRESGEALGPTSIHVVDLEEPPQ